MTKYETTEADLKSLKKFAYGLNRWVKLEPNESKDWEFNPKTVREVPSNFDKNKNRIEFDVYDPHPEVEHEFVFQTSYKTARKITNLMEKGKTFLRVKRIGEGLKTEYEVEEVTG